MPVDISQFVQVFYEETEENLSEMERLLLNVDIQNPDAEDLNAIFRAAHSIKGGSATFGLTNITEVTHVLESLLDRVRQGTMQLNPQLVDAFLNTKDVLKMLLEGQRDGASVDLQEVAHIQTLLRSFLDDKNPEGAINTSSSKKQSTGSSKSAAEQAARCYEITLPVISDKDLAALEQELALFGHLEKRKLEGGNWVFTLDTEYKDRDIIDVCSFLVDENQLTIKQIDGVSQAEKDQGFGFFEPFEPLEVKEKAVGAGSKTTSPVSSKEVKTGDKKTDKAAHESTIRVGIEKVDQLINLVGELVITQAMIDQSATVLDPLLYEKLIAGIHALKRNTRDLQESVMSIRMMPMDYVFSRFPRMIHDMANKLGKRVQLVTNGDATELDKGLIEHIVDPLTHLIRNSLDHGIEMPEVRSANGKSPVGTVTLSAEHRGGNIIIEVSDDGAGLNKEKIIAKAKERGMQVTDNMSDNDAWQLIFEPGFSTADKITDVSGRGVGMDVVKRNILEMGGAVDIRSRAGKGSTTIISVPLTLAILDGMSICVGDEIYILPLGYIVESLKPREEDIKEVSGYGRVLKVRDEYLPLMPLYEIFNITPKTINPMEGLVVILESDGKKAALFVDDLVGQQQIVVKNLESNYRKVTGISGATILGDGGVALIIDVASLLRSSKRVNEETVFS